MIIQSIAFDSAEYQGSLALRDRVLRQPLGMTLAPRDVVGEDANWHFAAMDASGKVVGTVQFQPVSASAVKLRYMAVCDTLHGQGVGKRLVEFAERFARDRAIAHIGTLARVTAQGFYARLGFEAYGEVFIHDRVLLDHIRMKKHLT